MTPSEEKKRTRLWLPVIAGFVFIVLLFIPCAVIVFDFTVIRWLLRTCVALKLASLFALPLWTYSNLWIDCHSHDLFGWCDVIVCKWLPIAGRAMCGALAPVFARHRSACTTEHTFAAPLIKSKLRVD